MVFLADEMETCSEDGMAQRNSGASLMNRGNRSCADVDQVPAVIGAAPFLALDQETELHVRRRVYVFDSSLHGQGR